MQLTEIEKLKLELIDAKLKLANLQALSLQKNINELYLQRDNIEKEFRKANNLDDKVILNVNIDTGEVTIREEKKDG